MSSVKAVTSFLCLISHKNSNSLSLFHQQASCKNHRVNRVVFLGNMKRLLTTGVSRWNTRQIALWDQVRRQRHMAHVCNARVGGAGVCVCVCVLIPCVCCSSQEDLSMPIVEEDIDGLSGLLFPFYDADTHMLYLAGKVMGHNKEMIMTVYMTNYSLLPYFSHTKSQEWTKLCSTLRFSSFWIIIKRMKLMV